MPIEVTPLTGPSLEFALPDLDSKSRPRNIRFIASVLNHCHWDEQPSMSDLPEAEIVTLG